MRECVLRKPEACQRDSRWLRARSARHHRKNDKINTAPWKGARRKGVARDARKPAGIPPGRHLFFSLISGGVARQASLNHRLHSCKPPACIPSQNGHGFGVTERSDTCQPPCLQDTFNHTLCFDRGNPELDTAKTPVILFCFIPKPSHGFQ